MKGKFLIIIEYLLLTLYLLLFHSSGTAFTFTLASKTALMPVLIILLLINIRPKSPVIIGTLLALIASTSGDFFMELNYIDQRYFLPGLGSFLLAHIFYIFTFSQNLNFKQITRKNYLVAAGLLLAAIALIAMLWPHLEQMKIPVIIYALVLAVVTWLAYGFCHAYLRKSCLVFWGSLLFLLSDAALAITLFVTQYPLHREANMILYVTGQTLIVLGILQTTKITKNEK